MYVLVCNRSRALNNIKRTRPSSTHIGWRLKQIFLKLLNLSRKKIKMLFTGLGWSVFGETVPSV